ncbi:MAG TPA: type II secretion system protein [Pyrinomonadaceae bacterium]|jgi:Tfp pilus assembly protein PilV|nr:type II secretion system protein [Pyrinomonadaceae bacterium]
MKDSRTHNNRLARGGVPRQEGFTILETVVALLIMMVAGFGAISLFVFSMSYNSGASDRARGLALAQQRMEVLRGTPYSNLSTVAAAMPTSENVGSPNTPDNDQRTFNVTTTVADDANVQNSHQKIITITATPASAGRWTGGGVTLRCYRSENVTGAN